MTSPPKRPRPILLPSAPGPRGRLLAAALWGSAALAPAAVAHGHSPPAPAPIETADEEPIAIYGGPPDDWEAPPAAEYGAPALDDIPAPPVALYGAPPPRRPPPPPPPLPPADAATAAAFQGQWVAKAPDGSGVLLDVEAVYYTWTYSGISERGQVRVIKENLLSDGATMYQVERFGRYLNNTPAPNVQEAWVVSEDRSSFQIGNKKFFSMAKKLPAP